MAGGKLEENYSHRPPVRGRRQRSSYRVQDLWSGVKAPQCIWVTSPVDGHPFTLVAKRDNNNDILCYNFGYIILTKGDLQYYLFLLPEVKISFLSQQQVLWVQVLHNDPPVVQRHQDVAELFCPLAKERRRQKRIFGEFTKVERMEDGQGGDGVRDLRRRVSFTTSTAGGWVGGGMVDVAVLFL